ncbi:hypothetical protein [Arthrobacter sp.]|uniref:hypothetical protein n=1 Tax=Arthrobacter sp. TaxID=1667 RepID=UPI0028124A0B|nr:hypothetical protein [Arthrobacter sp.]
MSIEGTAEGTGIADTGGKEVAPFGGDSRGYEVLVNEEFVGSASITPRKRPIALRKLAR